MLPLYPVGEPGFRVAYHRRPMRVRHFVKYTFLKVDPAWRRLDSEQRAEHKREFAAACEDFADGHLLRAFSLVGTRGDADMMLLSQAQNLERIHEFHVVLQQSGLMKWCATPLLVPGDDQGIRVLGRVAPRGAPAHGKYLFVYPFVKTREWYLLDAQERWRIMQEHIKVGTRVPVDRPEHELLVRTRRPGVRGRVRVRRPGGLSSTSCRSCGRPSRARSPSATRRRSPASRARWSAPSARSTARRWRSPPSRATDSATGRRRLLGRLHAARQRCSSGLSGGWLRVRYVEVATSFPPISHWAATRGSIPGPAPGTPNTNLSPDWIMPMPLRPAQHPRTDVERL